MTQAGHSEAALIKALKEEEFSFHGWRTTVIIQRLYTGRGAFLTSPTTFLLICFASTDISPALLPIQQKGCLAAAKGNLA